MNPGEKKNLTIGIIANTNKENVAEVISEFVSSLNENGLDFLLSDSLLSFREKFTQKITKTKFIELKKLMKRSDVIISIGGDGTMLATAYQAQFYDKPVLGVNYGKLGFLAELSISQMTGFIGDLKKGNYIVEERMVLVSECVQHKIDKLYAINDIVIEKGGWPKMIEITVYVDGEYVTTFAADGLIVATPTGSTGYSLSTGGPIVSPKSDVITLSPVSPHSLTVRPLVLPSHQRINVMVNSPHKDVQVSCDGQRVYAFPPPLEIVITKCRRSLKLIHTTASSYFDILRNKLLWGLDIRKNNFKKEI